MSDHISGASQKAPTSIQTPSRFELEFSRLGRSIDESVIAAAGSVFWLVFAAGERGFPPFDAPLEDAIKRFGSPPQAALDLWRQCAAIDRLRRRWTGKGLEVPAYATVAAEVRRARETSEADREAAAAGPDVEPLPVAPIDEVGPDEAVGRPAGQGNGADDQPRLTGA
jgi:hypothetical protein